MSRKIFQLAALALLAAACNEGAGDQASLRRPGSEVSEGAEGGGAAGTTRAPRVVFLGTSLTAGYGLASDQAYPALIQERIDSAGWDLRVVNAGVSGETSAGGLRRLDWLLRQPLTMLVIELGANDMLRGQDLDALRVNLQEVIDRTRERYPEARIVIAGMRAPPNLGLAYARGYAEVYRDLARRNDVALIPFLLEGVAGVPSLNQADGIHPTAEGQRLVAENVWRVLEPILKKQVTGNR